MLCVCLLLTACGGKDTTDGWYLETIEGSEAAGPLIVRDDTDAAIVEALVDKSETGGLFDGLESGDRIRITFDMPAGSPWPGVDWVYTCELPEEALAAMEEAGCDFGRHTYTPADAPQTVDAPVSGWCGSTSAVGSADGQEYPLWGSDAIALTDILVNLAYTPEVCRCAVEYTVDTESGGSYGVNLTESFARCEAGQAALTEEQVEAIQEILAQNCGV